MKNKYFGTDGIRGTVNQGNITGEKFFKFGLASGTYFKNQKKSKQIAIIAKRHKAFRIYIRTSFSFRISFRWNACIYFRTVTDKWSRYVNKVYESKYGDHDNSLT